MAMRPLLLLALLAACAEVSAAAAPPITWLPLPAFTWHSDQPTPQGAGLLGRALAIVVIDWDRREGNTGPATFWSLRWWWNDGGRPIDFRQGALMLSSGGGQFNHKDPDKAERILKGQDTSGGLVRALGGDASAVVMLVNAQGRVVRIMRCSGDANGFAREFDALVPKEAALVANESQFPVACKPATDLLKEADVKGALALCARKLGADGAALAKAVAERADALLDAELAVLDDGASQPSARLIARGRVEDLLAAFPQAKRAADAGKALKALKADKAVATEQAAWAALTDYLAQAAKAPPKKLPEVQKQLLGAITAKFPETYAAELAGMIRTASRLDP
jgi:hypothetical protein